ncbi:MAG: protein kinase [Myxococcales bacterium]
MVRRLQANQGTSDTELVLDNKFRVLEVRSESAELRVCAGLHLQTERQVELHMLPAGLAASGPEAERLVRAARASGRAPHVNMLNVLDSGTDADGRPFVVYERFEGTPADELIRLSGPFRLREVGHIMGQILLALETLHARGVVHRFLRPDRLLIERRDGAAPRVKLSGLHYAIWNAKAAGKEPATAPELPRGFSRFLAPEVRRGEASTTPAIDIYAAGVLMRFLLTGDSDPNSELDATAARAIEHATADDPDERFLTAETFASAVAQLVPEEERLSIPPADPLAADLKYMHRRRAKESGVVATPNGEGRLELHPVLLMVEALYARFGAQGWPGLVNEVPDVEQLLPAAGRRDYYLEQGVPMDLVARFLSAADRLQGTGDLRSLADLGQALVKRGLGRFCKELPHPLTADGLIDCVPAIWSSLSRHGEVAVLERKPQAARIAVRAQVEPSLELCAVMAGLLRAQLRAVAQEAEVNTVASQSLGDAADVFVLSWS